MPVGQDNSAEAVDTRNLVEQPLMVDLDRVLVPTNLAHEILVAAYRVDPKRIIAILRCLWSRAGDDFAEWEAEIDPAALAYDHALVSRLLEEERRGRAIVLVSGCRPETVERIARFLGFSGASARSMTVGSPIARDLLTRSEQPPRPRFRTLSKAFRIQHWAKNCLVFVAPILGYQLGHLAALFDAVVLFLAMGALASATYLLNDLSDLKADRAHPRKKTRPLASGAMSLATGFVSALSLAAIAAVLAALLPWKVIACLGAYLIVTLLYSAVLKRQPIIDVFVLAGLFTLRVLAGSFLIPAPISPWLLTFSMTFFLGLAMTKRYAELDRTLRTMGRGVESRGYTDKELPLLLASGIASGFAAIVIFVIYLMNEHYPREIYSNPGILWGLMPLILVWILRIWHLTIHGRMSEDPVVFALRDRFSLSIGLLGAVLLVAAWS
jgi:4-hydroxybenzoate polyprenyltransferase